MSILDTNIVTTNLTKEEAAEALESLMPAKGSRAWVAAKFGEVVAELRQGRPAAELWEAVVPALDLWLAGSSIGGKTAFPLLVELQCKLRECGPQAVMDQVEGMLVKGGKEYAQEEDAFAQFKGVARQVRVTPFQALRVYASKHVNGIQAHFNGYVSQREPVEDRVKDLLTYLVLARFMKEAAQ